MLLSFISAITASVLIESDWNLKTEFKDALNLVDCSINRIRLEFKGHKHYDQINAGHGINRIRLEFKAIKINHMNSSSYSINRIRLEFKAGFYLQYVIRNKRY